ncbi:MAG: helicase-related protein [Spirochaetes bacterium]|nr:helicase-related protein [Spirochaetota bacterium]
MDLHELGLHENLVRGAGEAGLSAYAPFIEMTIGRLIGARENVSAQVKLGEGRPAAFLVPAMQWLLDEGAGRRALVIVPADKDIASVERAAAPLAAACGITMRTVGREPDTADGSASLVIGSLDSLLLRHESDTFSLGDFGFVAIDGVDRMTEPALMPSAQVLRGFLPPPAERRTVLFSSLLGPKERSFAFEIADNPSEIFLEAESERARQVPQTTWYVSSDAKLRLALGIMTRENLRPVCVFCNLKDSADETAKRFEMNGLRSEYIIGNMPGQRKSVIVDRLKRGELDVLVLTDEGAEGIEAGFCALLINYDIPLEGENYLTRIELVDKDSGRIVNFACDRYVYGIPAIEQIMGTSMDAVQVDEALFAPVDKSSGMVFERKRPVVQGGRPQRDGRPRDGREGRPIRDVRGGRNDRPGRPGERTGLRPEIRGSLKPRDSEGDVDGNRIDANDRNRQQRDVSRPEGPGRQRREHGGRNDYHRDAVADAQRLDRIRNGIAEATGGSIDMVAGAFSNPKRERPETPSGRQEKSERGDRSDRGERKRKSPKQARGVSDRDTKPLSDPYAVSMEERMKLYREKYGKKMVQEEDKREEDKKRRKRGRRGRRDEGGTRTDTPVQNGKPAVRQQEARQPERKQERRSEARFDSRPEAGSEPRPAGTSGNRRGGRRRRGGGKPQDGAKQDNGGRNEGAQRQQRPPVRKENPPAREGKKGGIMGRILGMFGKKK